MKNKKKRFPAILAATAVIISSVMSMSGSAAKPVRDASGDGETLLNDAFVTITYLAGGYNPTNVKSFDFDGNGIISDMDTMKIRQYLVHNISDDKLPDPSTETVQAVATTRTYKRHYFSSSNPASYSQYSLTVDRYDNTVSGASVSPYSLVGDNDMIRDYDETAVVNLKDTGSGFIVGDHVIATAGHCVYDGKNFKYSDIRIVDKNNNEKVVSPKYVDVPANYAPSTKYDYALIYVDEDLSEYGALKMGVALNDYTDKKGDVIVSGFPGSYPDNYAGFPYGIRFKAKGKIVNTKNGKLYYDADTAGGNSGGPVYAEEAFVTSSSDPNGNLYEYKTVIAIHTSGFNELSEEKANSGVMITPDVLKFYYDNSNVQY